MRLRAAPAAPRSRSAAGSAERWSASATTATASPPGRRLVLGGVEIEHDQGLEGHSDADVLTHAVIDALLGATGGGDIGDDVPRRRPGTGKDADSIDLLRTVVGTIAGPIVNIDATLICEQPRLGPYKAEMERITRRGDLGPGQRQGDQQRGHGLRSAAARGSPASRWRASNTE